MLNFRLKTFMELARILNYTETAKKLHISQPAVSQHIKFLEDKYNTKLFHYRDRVLTLTDSGLLLYDFIIGIDSSSKKIEDKILNNISNPIIKFGTTLTIGQYTMPNILSHIISDYPNISIDMEVGNTKNLLNKLDNGLIDFALLEGQFNKSNYNTYKLSDEDFIGVCSPNSDLLKDRILFDDIFNERLIIRESGSGSRDIFESILYEHNYTMDSFKYKTIIGNIQTIKNLVKENLGITFLYKKAVEKELQNGSLRQIDIEDFKVRREYNMVFLKYSLNNNEYKKWFNYFKRYK